MKLRCERTNHFGSLCGCLHTEHFIQWLKRLNKLLHKRKMLCKCSQLIIYLTLDWNPLRNIAVRWHHDSAVHYQTQAHAAASAHKPLSTVLGPAHHKEILRKIRPSPLCLRSVTGQTLFFFPEKEEICTIQENSHDCEGWIAAATPVRTAATRLQPGGAAHKVAVEMWLIGRERFRVLALCLSSMFGPHIFNFAPRRNIFSFTHMNMLNPA